MFLSSPLHIALIPHAIESTSPHAVESSPTASHIMVTMSQRHLPRPDHPLGHNVNSGYQPNFFVVWVDSVRQGKGGHNATFFTDKSQ